MLETMTINSRSIKTNIHTTQLDTHTRIHKHTHAGEGVRAYLFVCAQNRRTHKYTPAQTYIQNKNSTINQRSTKKVR